MISWWSFTANLAMAGFEAQRVIALRILKLSGGGKSAQWEARRMVTEKVAASAEAVAMLATGSSPAAVLKRTRMHMRANKRRLGRKR